MLLKAPYSRVVESFIVITQLAKISSQLAQQQQQQQQQQTRTIGVTCFAVVLQYLYVYTTCFVRTCET